VTLAALAEEPFVLGGAGCDALALEAFAVAGLAPRVAYEVGDVPTMLALVAEGLGVTLVPALSIAGGVPGVVARPLDPPFPRRLALAVRDLEAATPAARAVLALAAER